MERLSSVVLDVADDDLAARLRGSFAPHGCHAVHPAGPSDAVAAVADLAADLVVVASHPADWASESDHDRLHRELALVPWWWARAAAVVGAHVLLVSHAVVLGDGPGPRDEFAAPRPVAAPGRALRAAEQLVAAPAPATVVRHEAPPDAGADATAALAELVRWLAAARLPGTFHLAGADGVLDDRHTRLVRTGAGLRGDDRR